MVDSISKDLRDNELSCDEDEQNTNSSLILVNQFGLKYGVIVIEPKAAVDELNILVHIYSFLAITLFLLLMPYSNAYDVVYSQQLTFNRRNIWKHLFSISNYLFGCVHRFLIAYLL